MLLSDLINKHYLASCVSITQVNERTWYGREQKHVHKDEDDIVDVIWLVILYGKQLVVRIRVVGSCHIDQKDHTLQVSVVRFVLVKRYRVKWVLIAGIKCKRIASDKRIANYYNREEDEIHQNVFVCRG